MALSILQGDVVQYESQILVVPLNMSASWHTTFNWNSTTDRQIYAAVGDHFHREASSFYLDPRNQKTFLFSSGAAVKNSVCFESILFVPDPMDDSENLEELIFSSLRCAYYLGKRTISVPGFRLLTDSRSYIPISKEVHTAHKNAYKRFLRCSPAVELKVILWEASHYQAFLKAIM